LTANVRVGLSSRRVSSGSQRLGATVLSNDPEFGIRRIAHQKVQGNFYGKRR
jgi:hypothetical protein